MIRFFERLFAPKAQSHEVQPAQKRERLAERFAALKAQGRKALIPYISAGDPDPAQTAAVLHALVAGGADALELGIPFSDPAADGETIQQANERALARGVTFAQTLAIVREFRATDHGTPLILMGYLNSFERAGFARAMADIAAAGGDAVILVDCPVEALADYDADLKTSGITPIMLIAPTTTADRRQHILAHAGGFLYFVSLRGVTGTQEAQADAIAADPLLSYMSALEHRRWATFYYLRGFTWGETKDEVGRTHDCLVDDWDAFIAGPRRETIAYDAFASLILDGPE